MTRPFRCAVTASAAFASFLLLTVASAYFGLWPVFAAVFPLTVLAALFAVIAGKQARIDRQCTRGAGREAGPS